MTTLTIVEAHDVTEKFGSRLAVLDCSTYSRCRSGASVKYLSHNCSFCIVGTVRQYFVTKHRHMCHRPKMMTVNAILDNSMYFVFCEPNAFLKL